jgi:hypothetical protein
MKQFPCNTQTVQNILAGRQSEDRRPIKGRPENVYRQIASNNFYTQETGGKPIKAPHKVGDILYVRETWWDLGWLENGKWQGRRESHTVGPRYFASCPDPYSEYIGGAVIPVKMKWQDTNVVKATFRKRPNIHMPKWAARIFLKVTAVRVERVRDISEADAIAEGMKGAIMPCTLKYSKRYNFVMLWKKLYPGSWERNDWVWVTEFERCEKVD